jgi:hypothetical protein
MTDGAAPDRPLTGRELVTRLLELTPAPDDSVDVAELMAAFETVIAQRAAVLAAVVPPITLSETDRPLLAELERRQGLWQDLLAQALRVVGGQRCAASQLRAYGGQR